MKLLTIGAAAVALALSSGAASAAQSIPFTISGGSAETIMMTTGPTPIPVGTTGYGNALLTIGRTRSYKFEFLGCGDSTFDNRFYLSGTSHFFDCETSKIGDSFVANLKVGDVGPHSPFHFQAAADVSGPSVFNGEGPLIGNYTGNDYDNTSIFYAIDGSMEVTGATSGNAVLLGFTDGGIPGDNDHQDLVVRISLPNQK